MIYHYLFITASPRPLEKGSEDDIAFVPKMCLLSQTTILLQNERSEMRELFEGVTLVVAYDEEAWQINDATDPRNYLASEYRRLYNQRFTQAVSSIYQRHHGDALKNQISTAMWVFGLNGMMVNEPLLKSWFDKS